MYSTKHGSVLETDKKAFYETLKKAQNHCFSKDKKDVLSSSPETWNKVYKVRRDVDKAYDELYKSALVELLLIAS